MVALPPPPRPPSMPRRVLTLLIDNYDSYTYNLYQMLAEVNGVAPIVIQNDSYDGDWHRAWAEFQAQVLAMGQSLQHELAKPLASNIVISPGPGHPSLVSDFGMCAEAIKASEVPVLGVCLGHQGLATVHGGSVVNATEVMHGRTSRVFLEELESTQAHGLFAHLDNGFDVVRYHSLVVADDETLPQEQLQVTARTDDGVIMAIQHRTKPQYGVQFHPEAVCSDGGYQLLQNFRDLTLRCKPSLCVLQHSDHAHRGGQEGSKTTAAAIKDRCASTKAMHSMNDGVEYRVLIERVATGLASQNFAQFVFDALFQDSKRSFWLDSSNHVHSAPESDASSNISDTSDENEAHDGGVQSKHTGTHQLSRFSYMGDNSGPLSECIEYSVLQKKLRVHRSDGSTETNDQVDLLTHLRARMQCLQAHRVEYLYDQGDGCGQEPSSTPFAFRGGYVGFFGYELLKSGLDDSTGVHHDASTASLREAMQQRLADDEYVPDASFLFADRTLIFDHESHCIYTLSVSGVCNSVDMAASEAWHVNTRSRLHELADRFVNFSAATGINATASTHLPEPHQVIFHPSRSREQYMKDIFHVQEQIHDGETYEVCLTNQLRASVAIRDPLAFYQQLRRRNPAPYAAFYLSNPDHRFGSAATTTDALSSAHTNHADPTPQTPCDMQSSYAICCSSPERFLRVSPDGWMESKPIKGTRRRGTTPAEDAEIASELATCPKDRAENMMIADLVRNDFGRVAQIGSVHVPALMRVESYATVHQLVTTVRARRHCSADTVDVLQATFPGGSMTGAPKKRTMQLIRQLERHPRGVYSGALGYLSLDGSCDLNIIIRTAVVTPQSVSLGSGGAIIALSDCEDEYDEMLLKTRALVQTVGAFITGRDDGTGARVATDF